MVPPQPSIIHHSACVFSLKPWHFSHQFKILCASSFMPIYVHHLCTFKGRCYYPQLWGHWGSQGSNSSSGSHTWWAVESGSNPRLGNSKMEFLPLLYLPKGRKATQLDFVPLPHPWTVALFPPPPTYPAVGPDCLLPLPIGSTAVSTCWYSSLCPHLLCIIP